MGALPKKKHAKARSKTRQAAIRLKLPGLVVCPNCGELKIPHTICSKCGSYGPKKASDEEKDRPKT